MSIPFQSPINLNKLEILNALFQNLSSAPSSPGEGQFYYDTVDHCLKVHNGTSWDRLDESYLLARANHTGTQLAATISDLAATVQAYRLDQFAAPTADVSLNSHKLTNLATPTGASDAATKGYADQLKAGIFFKDPVRAVATSNITLSGTQTIDGVSVIAGDRVLVAGQTTGADNGIYVVAAGAWARSTDADTSAEVKSGTAMFVTEGTTYGNTQWQLTTDDPITLGTTALTFTQFNGGGSSYTGDEVTIHLTGTQFSVKPAWVVPLTQGGTGEVTAAAALAALGGIRTYAANIGDGSTTAIVVTHNLGTRDVTWALYKNGSPYNDAVPDFERTTINTATVTFAVAPTTDAWRIVIQG